MTTDIAEQMEREAKRLKDKYGYSYVSMVFCGKLPPVFRVRAGGGAFCSSGAFDEALRHAENSAIDALPLKAQ